MDLFRFRSYSGIPKPMLKVLRRIYSSDWLLQLFVHLAFLRLKWLLFPFDFLLFSISSLICTVALYRPFANSNTWVNLLDTICKL